MAIHARLITPPDVKADDVPQIEQSCDCGKSIVAASTDERLERFINVHACCAPLVSVKGTIPTGEEETNP